MRAILGGFFWLLLFGLMFWFCWLNWHTVSIDFAGGSVQLPLVLALLASFTLGVLLTILLVLSNRVCAFFKRRTVAPFSEQSSAVVTRKFPAVEDNVGI